MESAAGTAPDTTTGRILDVAERLVQTRGFNGFSYADIAAEVGITKASLHYHFATKADLGRTLIARYTENFGGALRRIGTAHSDAHEKLRRYLQLYRDVLANERMCLCGMVAAEYGTLPKGMQTAIHEFFELNEAWLAGLLDQGSKERSLALHAPAREAARLLVSALEGAMLVARSYADPARFDSAARQLFSQLEVSRGPSRAGRARPRAPRAARPARA
ncbi:MAG TPA: TetR/AcrR family transcriptional regulator [Steroidobacteraceae bacterium]|nr:TetR/AcrR family transcriptional regulator [Steroidobacteraceae bacterium]